MGVLQLMFNINLQMDNDDGAFKAKEAEQSVYQDCPGLVRRDAWIGSILRPRPMDDKVTFMRKAYGGTMLYLPHMQN